MRHNRPPDPRAIDQGPRRINNLHSAGNRKRAEHGLCVMTLARLSR
jgi:hypothetical protein